MICSAEAPGIAMAFARTKRGGHFSFHFNSSTLIVMIRLARQQNSMAELLVASKAGLRCWNVKKSIWFVEFVGWRK
jgi:hypothetical protein